MLPLSSSNAKWRRSHPWVSVTLVRAANLHDGGHKVRERKSRVGSTADRRAGEPSVLVHLGTSQKAFRQTDRQSASLAQLACTGEENRGKKERKIAREKEGKHLNRRVVTQQAEHRVNRRDIWTASQQSTAPPRKHNIALSPLAPPSLEEVKPSWHAVYLTDEGGRAAPAASKCFTGAVNQLLRMTNK